MDVCDKVGLDRLGFELVLVLVIELMFVGMWVNVCENFDFGV